MDKKLIKALFFLFIFAVFFSFSASAKFENIYNYGHDEPDLLFNIDLNEDEELEGWSIESTSPYVWFTPFYIQQEYVVRRYRGTLTITEDATISEIVHLYVGEYSELVINEGVTLTIQGGLEITTTVKNHGTIILGHNQATSVFMPGVEDEMDTPAGIIQNKGQLINYGTISITKGQIQNEQNALIENKGNITISNKIDGLTAITNVAVYNGYKYIPSTFKNAGTITVDNTKGTGIWNMDGAVFENNGDIISSKTEHVKGTISGNAVINLNK